MSDFDSEEKVKKTKSKRTKKQASEELDTSDEEVIDRLPTKKAKSSAGFVKNADGDEMMPIGKMKYVTVRSFKGIPLVDIREYYMDKGDGKLKPGKKGISLQKDQYEGLKKVTAEIDKRLAEA